MDIKEFRSKVKNQGGRFSNKSYGGLGWPDWYKLARMTGQIYYGCNFDNDGKCIKLRDDLKANPNANEMCCCNQCKDHVGYLKLIENKKIVIKKISGLFDSKLGFWRKDKGCSLPRKYRSSVCLAFRCDLSKKHHTITPEKRLLITFMEGINCHLSQYEIYTFGKALLKIVIH